MISYTASSATFPHIPANGGASDLFASTVEDQWGDVSTGTVKISVANPAGVIKGSAYGYSTIEGTSGADVIEAYGYFKTIHDNGGNDLVNAGAGAAAVDTGAGDVVVNLNGYFDKVSGVNGWHTVSGGQGRAFVSLGDGNDSVSTGGYFNRIVLGSGADTVNSGLGDAEVLLGDGADTVYAAGYGNHIKVGSGADTIFAGAGQDQVTAGAGMDAITLGGFNDKVTLNGSTATVSAGQGAETVVASGGNDTLAFAGRDDVAELSGAISARIADHVSGLRIDVGSSTEMLSLTGFGAGDPTGIIELLNGAGGYKSVAAAFAALHSGGHGGAMLSLGANGSIDFVNTAISQLRGSNFGVSERSRNAARPAPV